LKVIVNLINDNKDKHLDSVAIISLDNSLMVWDAYSSDALFDNIMGHDQRASNIYTEFMEFIKNIINQDPND